MKRILVTGATGFLGRSLVPQLLAARAKVTAHGRTDSPFDPDLDYVRCDLTQPAGVDTALVPWRWDAVINLAGPVTGGAEDMTTGMSVIRAHVAIALQLRRVMHPTTRVVQASSMTVYGMPTQDRVREDHPRAPLHLYGLAKVLAEDVWLTDPALDARVLRLPGLFSERRKGGALYHFCRAARRGDPLHVTTPVPTPWDVLHVDDAADACVIAALKDGVEPGPFNISYGEPVELVAIATWIAAHAGMGSHASGLPGVVHPVFCLDNTAARTRLGWHSRTLHERLARIYDAFGDS